jgi:transposase
LARSSPPSCSSPGHIRAASAPRPPLPASPASHPIPASSGQTVRHRLSRGGDRQLNRALHTIVLHRRQHDAATRDCIARRVAEGKSRREATRLLKRYLARHLYRLLQNQEPLMA